MDARIVPEAQLAHLASEYRPALRLQENTAARRRKVIAMYNSQTPHTPIQREDFLVLNFLMESNRLF
jgi:hypothetical protein